MNPGQVLGQGPEGQASGSPTIRRADSSTGSQRSGPSKTECVLETKEATQLGCSFVPRTGVGGYKGVPPGAAHRTFGCWGQRHSSPTHSELTVTTSLSPEASPALEVMLYILPRSSITDREEQGGDRLL